MTNLLFRGNCSFCHVHYTVPNSKNQNSHFQLFPFQKTIYYGSLREYPCGSSIRGEEANEIHCINDAQAIH